MSQVTVNFKFEIGDFVYFADSPHREEQTPRHFMIYARMMDQCTGGIQLWYKISGYKDWIPEITLTTEMPPYETISDRDLEARAHDQNRRHEMRLGLARMWSKQDRERNDTDQED